MQRTFEKQAVRVPVSRVVREDLHSIRKITTIAGNISYRAPSNEDGHADRSIALALAIAAFNEGKAGGASTQRVKNVLSANAIMERAFGNREGITL